MAPGIDPIRRAFVSCLGASRPAALTSVLRAMAMPEGWLAGRLRYELLSRLPAPRPRNPSPAALTATGPGIWPGMPERGTAILRGEIELLGRRLPLLQPFWTLAPDSERLVAELHGFAWLADLISAGNAGIVLARQLIDQWLLLPQSRSRSLRHPGIAGRRLAAWLQSADRLQVGGDSSFDQRFRERIVEETIGLARLLPGGLCGAALIEALKGLLLA